MPDPSYSLRPCRRLNIPKIRSRWRGSMPMPLSVTEKSHSSPMRSAETTTSAAESDVLRMYKLHANSYITKPVGFVQFLSAIQHIEEFWLTLVRLSDGIGPSW